MKRILAVILAMSAALLFAACSGAPEQSATRSPAASAEGVGTATESDNTAAVPASSEPGAQEMGETTNEASGSNTLVAYFSATGTTKGVAEKVAAATGGDIYEIVPAEPYTAEDLGYSSDCRANDEMNDPQARPAMSGNVEDMADYDVVFLGYPIWWGEAPRIMSTFLESNDLSGKTVITFCTSGSSPINDAAISELAPGADWVTGVRLSGGASPEEIAEWIDGLGVDVSAS